MQSLSIRKLAMLAGMAVIASLGSARSALADLTVTAAETGFATQTLVHVVGSASSGLSGGNLAATEGNFTIQIQGASTSQTSNISEALGSATQLINNDFTTSHTLTLVITATGYTQPLAGTIASLIGGSTPNGSTLVTFSSTVTDGTTTTHVNNAPFTASGTSSYNSSANGSISGLTSGYTITETIVFQMSGSPSPGAQINYSSSTVLTATPEPATVAMALTALPLLGIGAWVRRRRIQA
jgi:hypothetical protein